MYRRRGLSGFDREFEDNVLICNVLVHLAESIQLSLNVDKVLRIKQNLKSLGTINLVSHSLADDLGRIDDVLHSNKKLPITNNFSL